jgi:hypothetical protein
MGRGRAKAKQTKVARELKYASGDLDINALTAELSSTTHTSSADAESDEYGDEYDTYDEDASRR